MPVPISKTRSCVFSLRHLVDFLKELEENHSGGHFGTRRQFSDQVSCRLQIGFSKKGTFSSSESGFLTWRIKIVFRLPHGHWRVALHRILRNVWGVPVSRLLSRMAAVHGS